MPSPNERPVPRARVLVVEDMAVVAMDIEATLTQLGHDVAGVARTGEDAIELAGAVQPDLVLMDINLAGAIDGIAAAEAIRRHRQIPVIYLTAYSDADTLQRAKVTEPFGFIVKPINRPELQASIQLALYRSQIERAFRESEERYAAVVRQSGEGIFLADIDGRRVLEANPAMQRLLGYDEHEFEALTLDDLLACDRETIDRAVEAAVAHGRPAPLAGHGRHKDGGLLSIDMSLSAITYGGSQTLCVLVRHRAVGQDEQDRPTACGPSPADLQLPLARLRQLVRGMAEQVQGQPGSAAPEPARLVAMAVAADRQAAVVEALVQRLVATVRPS